MATAQPMTELPPGFTLDPAELPPGFEVDQPKRKLGVVETALRTAAQTAAPVVRTLGLAESTLQRVFRGPEAQQGVIGRTEKTVEGMKEAYNFKPEEEPSTTGELAGGVLATPIAVLGQGVAPGVSRAADVVERGGTLPEAAKAGAVSGAVQQILINLPAYLGGKAVERAGGGAVRQGAAGAAAGAATNVVSGAAGRVAESAALPAPDEATRGNNPSAFVPAEDRFGDLRQEALDPHSMLVEAGMGAVFGAHGAVKSRKARLKAEAERAPPFPEDQMVDLGDGNFRAPNGSTITKDAWENSSKRVREGWLERPKEEKPTEEREPKPQAELDRLREEHPAGPVADVVRELTATNAKKTRAKADADELRRAAHLTTDPDIRTALLKRAEKLDPTPKVPAGTAIEGAPKVEGEQPKKIPVGETKEGQPEIKTEQPEKIPAGETIEEKLPVGETNEAPGGGQIPVGEATEITRSGVEPTQEPKPGSIPKGETKELYVPPEKKGPADAAQQVVKQEGVQRERVEGNESRQTAETGGGDRVQRPAEGEGAKPQQVAGDEAEKIGKKLKDLYRDGAVGKDVLAETNSILAKEPDRVEAARKLQKLLDKHSDRDADIAFDIAKREPLTFPKIEESMIDAAEREKQRGVYRSTPRADDGLRVVGKEDRGITQVRNELRQGMREGTVHKDGGELALWALERNPNLARGLKLKARGEKGPGLGLYDHAVRAIELFKDNNVRTAPHEIFHHTERMMPEIVQTGIRREWKRALREAIGKAKTPAEKQALRDMQASAFRGDAKARMRAMDAMREGIVDKDRFYHLLNPSEFWAVNAARILHERHVSRGSWRGQAKQWLKEFVEKAKGIVGVRSDAPLLKALDEVLNPKKVRGERSDAKLLSEGGGREPQKVPRDFQAPLEDISTKPPKRTLGDETGAERTERALFDRFNRVTKLQKAEAPKSEAADIYRADQLFQGRAQHRGDVLEREYVKPLGAELKAASKQGLTLRDADDYLMALHAPERNRAIAAINPKMPDGGSGLTNAQAKKIVDGFTSEQRKSLDKIAKIVHDMNRAKLDAMVEDGLIKPELRDALNAKYKKYVPLKTLEQEDSFLGIGQGYSMRANDIKEALGRSSKAGSPVSASLADAARAIVRGEKARVDQAIWKYAQDPKAHDFIKPYDPSHPPKEVMGRKKGSDGQVKDVVDSQKVRDLTVDLVIDGEQQKVFVPDQLLRDQIKKLATVNDPGKILGAIGKVTSSIGRLLTEFNPAFTLPNAARDAITVGLRSKAHGLSPAKVLSGIPSAWKTITKYKLDPKSPDAKQYEEFLSAGGKTGAYGVTDLADTMHRLEKEGAKLGYDDFAKGSTRRKALNTLGSAAKVLSGMNEVMEYASRFSAYQQARAAGKSVKESAAIAKEITVNFNRSGEYGRALNSVLVFANAALQGLRNSVVYGKHPAVQKGMLGLVALGAAAQAWNENVAGMDAETGEANANTQNDAMADKNLMIMAPDSRAGIKIPLPPEYSWLYALGRRAYRAISQGNWQKDAAGIAGNMLDAVLPVRLPESDSGALSAAKSVVLTPAVPFVDIWTNTNYFGQPIVPDRHDATSPAPYYTSSRTTTSDIAKGVSEMLNTATGGDKIKPGLSEKALGPLVSPEGIEHIVGYYTGGVGQLAMQSKNIVKNAAGGEPVDVNKIPIANRFVFDEPKSYTSRRYKELRPDFEYAIDYQKAGTPEKIDPKIERALGEFQASERELRVLFKRLKSAASSGDETEKKAIQEDIKRAQSRVIRAYNGQPVQ